MRHAAHLYNRTASPVLGMRTPFEPFLGKVPKLSKIMIFDCLVYAHIYEANRKTKLHDHAEMGLYLGTNGGLYRIMLLRSKQIITTKHVTFDVGFIPLAQEQTATILLNENSQDELVSDFQIEETNHDHGENVHRIPSINGTYCKR